MNKFKQQFAVATTALLLAFPVVAQQASVTKQLDQASQLMTKQGYAQAERDLLGKLNDDGKARYTIFLQKGTPYRILGFCDNDCKDLDLILFDENNKKVAEDTSTDDIPVINITPKWTGKFTLSVEMDDCKKNPCGWGVRIFAPK